MTSRSRSRRSTEFAGTPKPRGPRRKRSAADADIEEAPEMSGPGLRNDRHDGLHVEGPKARPAGP
jgi:hypothetical protein